jgi:hypothetical protein
VNVTIAIAGEEDDEHACGSGVKMKGKDLDYSLTI